MKILLVISFFVCYIHNSFEVPVYESDYYNNDLDNEIDLTAYGDLMYGQPTEEASRRLSRWNPETGGNAEEYGPYFEGDILIPRPKGRNGITDKARRWKGGVVPFVIDGSFNAHGMDMIEKAINAYHKYTCIRLTPRNNEHDYIAFTNKNTGCWASVGRIGGRQEVNLETPGCTNKQGTAMHEIMHSLGFLHEQNRPERDDYVTIQYENIIPETRANFQKADPKTTNGLGVQYDYASVMHYSSKSFSKNGKATIVPKGQAPLLGQRDGFSKGDINKVNKMYGCGLNQGFNSVQQYPRPGGNNHGNFFPGPSVNHQHRPHRPNGFHNFFSNGGGYPNRRPFTSLLPFLFDGSDNEN